MMAMTWSLHLMEPYIVYSISRLRGQLKYIVNCSPCDLTNHLIYPILAEAVDNRQISINKSR
jgi:hypothetical protein